MLTIRDFEVLREAYSANSGLAVDEAWRRIGSPTGAALIAYACEQMSNPDRNVRVLMLRILARQTGARAAHGVLSGLRDIERRVCAVAIQACPNYLHREDIVRELVSIATDANRKLKLRRRALSMLSGDEGRWRGDLTNAIFAALAALIEKEAFRFPVLFGLIRLEMAPRVESLLALFAESNDEAERLLAKRALDGEVVVHLDNFADNLDRQRQIMERCDIAYGRMYYWIPRESSVAGLPA
ncbi:MAG: hypothetical protein OXG39_01900 [Chloroflexi bacterium]|nr:hypothetical protein [Chloroflexota bacterium]